MEEVVIQEENLAQAKKSMRESSSEQFWKYMNDHNVLEIFVPALTLLYEMPIQPENLYEFFAEFLENGAQDLVKISHLQSELCYKYAELQQIHDENPDLWNQYVPNQSQFENIFSMAHIPGSTTQVERMSAATDFYKRSTMKQGLESGSQNILDFLPLDEEELIEYLRRPRNMTVRGSSIGSAKIFKLEEDKGQMGSGDGADVIGLATIDSKEGTQSIKEEIETILPPHVDVIALDVPPKRDSKDERIKPIPEVVEVIEVESPTKTRKIKARKKGSLESGKGKDKIVEESQPKGSRQKDAKGKKLSAKEGNRREGSQVKGHRVKGSLSPAPGDIDLSFYAKDEETMTGPSLLEIPPFKRNIPLKVMHRRISKLVSGIEDPEERLAMENVLLMITDHKKMDPHGILFDFNRRHSEREYELELFAQGASEDLLRRLSHRKSSGYHPGEFHGNLDEDKPIRFSSSDGEMHGMYASTRRISQRKLSEEEVKEILTDQNHRRLVRDGLKFLRDIRKEAVKQRRQRIRRNSGIDPDCSNCVQSDSDSNVSSDEDSAKKSEQLLRMLRETFTASVDTKAPICSTMPEEPFEEEPFRDPSEQPSIVVTSAEEAIATGEQSAAISPTQPLKHLSKKKLNTLIDELFFDYKKHMDFVDSVAKPDQMSIYIAHNGFVQELDKRFHAAVLQRRDETLSGLQRRSTRTLAKKRKYRFKKLRSKKGSCKNIGYTKFEPFWETKTREELHRAYAITMPAITDKEFENFVERFDSKGKFDCEGLRTKADFIYDFPLKNVKATQRWIDKTFDESIFNLNEPLGEPQEESDFDDDDDDNFIWVEDFKDVATKNKQIEGAGQNLSISLSDHTKIQQYFQQLETCGEDEVPEPQFFDEVTDGDYRYVKYFEESSLPKSTELILSQSVLSLLHTRPLQKPFSQVKRSERLRKYVDRTFNPLTKEIILNQFAFELLDDD